MTAGLLEPKAIIPKGAPDGRGLVFFDLSWHDYETIGHILRNRPNLRMTFDRGALEIMTTSSEHEWLKKRLDAMIQILVEESGLTYAPLGNMTFQRETLERGFEPDECYWIANEPRMRTRQSYDPESDPPPDLLLEIEQTQSALPRMKIFAAFGVPEVWRFDGERLVVHVLQGSEYREMEHSPTLPKISVGELVQFLDPDPERDFIGMIRKVRDWGRGQLKRSQQ